MYYLKSYQILFVFILFISVFYVPPNTQFSALAGEGCTTKGCHLGISDIVPERLEMMQLIKKNGQRHGDMDGCVICHGGNPNSKRKKKAHRSIPPSLMKAAGPKAFYKNPGDLKIAKNTCGVCHPGYVYRAERSLMNTAAGQIQASLHAWGIKDVKDGRTPYGNYTVKDSDGPIPMGASKAYDAYMSTMIRQYPGQYPESLSSFPLLVASQIEEKHQLAGFELQRQKCQKCHIGVEGRNKTGDFRGSGCAACHMQYGNDGFYKGKDASIPQNTAGHILIHQIRGNRKTGGIHVDTCNACHNGGKSVGTSYTGLMESALKEIDLNSPLTKNGKTYLKLSADLHHRSPNSKQDRSTNNTQTGLLCQDCHTSMDIHGDGNISGSTLAQVEIECTDCHGTPDKLPWELALGYGDEFDKTLPLSPRGLTTQKLLSQRQFGFDFDPKDGFLLSARGNPLENVVLSQNSVIVHSARGVDFKVPLLKQINSRKAWKTDKARTAMVSVKSHTRKMECYACHSTWTPQAYGSRVKVKLQLKKAPTIETRHVYLRWEDPVLGINGEGNISPLAPGCQLEYTIIGKNNTILAQDILPQSPSTIKTAGQKHSLSASDTAPVQPHTTQRKARTCENCHTSPKTAGLGSTYVPEGAFDWSKIITGQGIQLTTIGTQWPLSRAFDKTQIDGFLRIGTCVGCHKEMDQDFWKKISTKGILDQAGHNKLMNHTIKQLIQKP